MKAQTHSPLGPTRIVAFVLVALAVLGLGLLHFT
jgi:hypothetical protein